MPPDLPGAPSSPSCGRLRLALLYALPTLLLLAWACLPLILGTHTLYLRDVFNTHLEKKWIQAEAMEEGRIPLVDPGRAGQPHAGNPNSVALHPDNLLYRVAPVLWAFNAHFWLHLLAAPLAFFCLARAWGLQRPAAWAAGVVYAGSGYFLSHLNLYNLVGGAAVAPAFIAAVLTLGRPGRAGRGLLAATAAWALLLLSGGPTLALLALLLAFSAAAVRRGWRGMRPGVAVGAVALGSLVAAPQLVELLRILPFTFRGFLGYSPAAASTASWSPAGIVGWLLPFPFGQPDLDYWGSELLGGDHPLYYSLYPGLLVLLLTAVSGWPRDRLRRWAWAAVAMGLFLALGRFNPLTGLLLEVPGAALLRLPVKLWLLVATGGALLAGLGFQRWLRGQAGRGLAVAALALAVLLGGAWLALRGEGGVEILRTVVPATFPDSLVEEEQTRLRSAAIQGVMLLGLLGIPLALRREGPVTAGAFLLALHLGTQLWLLAPLMATDRVEPYREPPQLLEAVPPDALMVHGRAGSLFGPATVSPRDFPDAGLHWLQRLTFRQLMPPAGILWGRRYELRLSPEGLDSFLTRAAAEAVQKLGDPARLRLLRSFGVEYLLLGRELEGGALEQVEAAGPEAVGVVPYRLRQTAPEIQVVGRFRYAATLPETISHLTRADFDPTREAVLAGAGVPRDGPPGRHRVLERRPERLVLETTAPARAALVFQRVYLPLHRATVDGREVEVGVANLHRVAVELPPGRHRVEVWVERQPFRLAWVVAALGGLLALLVARRLGRQGSRSPEAGGSLAGRVRRSP